MESYRSKCGCMPKCNSMINCEPMPICERRCIGTHTTKHKIYQNCSYEICKVCSYCGHEYNIHQHHRCTMCGAPSEATFMEHSMNDPMDDPPQAEVFGRPGFGRFGGFSGFGRRRFGGFGRHRFGFFPFFPIFPFSPFFFHRHWF
ncbi:MAG: hypothetical protein H6Q68_754 [Firmicutes bacterium]|nr:hypothetical protein [Bacillota bacterium]